jgi:hypothetical protein
VVPGGPRLLPEGNWGSGVLYDPIVVMEDTVGLMYWPYIRRQPIFVNGGKLNDCFITRSLKIHRLLNRSQLL